MQGRATLNHFFCSIWSEALGTYIAVPECCNRKSKSAASSILRGCLLTSVLLASPVLWAEIPPDSLPRGGQTIRGQVDISSSGQTMQLNQGSHKAIVEWQSFDIGKQASVTINQPDATSTLLNRVIGANPSNILGRLNANGQVILINPNGVLFGADARIDVGSIVASTLNISNDDFLNGQLHFTQGSLAGGITQLGNITADSVALVGASIVNQGSITAGKDVALATGESVQLSFDDQQLVSVEVTPANWNAHIENGGIISADNGLVLIKADVAAGFLASVVSTSHQNTASEVVVENGRIQLVSNSGLIAGRSIKLDAGDQGQTLISGTLDASSSVAEGGRIEVTGGSVKVSSTGNITADGKNGGGEIYIGGGWQGENPNIRQAQTTTIEAGASISASATDNGDGGTVVVWSDINDPDSVTTVNGTIKAEGRGAGKQGGNVETSGYRVKIGDQTRISTLSAQGSNGQWLIDPKDYTVAASGGDITGSVLSTNLASGNVTIESASGSTDGSGDIHINDAISWSANNLTLTADRDININAVMTASGTSTLTMTANNNSSDDSDPFDPDNTPGITRTALGTIGRVRVGIYSGDNKFKGKVDFDGRSGSGFLTINNDNYIVISSVTGTSDIDLDEVTSADATVRYALGSDLDASLLTAPISYDFRGILDGLGHTLDGMSISSTGARVGLFGKLGLGSTVRNLGITNASATSANNYVGLLAGESLSGTLIHNTFASGAVKGLSYVGGLVGDINANQAYAGTVLLENVVSDVRVTATHANSWAGGQVGRIYAPVNVTNYPDKMAVLFNVHATGNIDAKGGYVGGLAGHAGGVSILDSYASGEVKAGSPGTTNQGIGGLVGAAYRQLTIDRAYANGDVFGGDNTGGLVGRSYDQTSVIPLSVSNSFASGYVHGLNTTSTDDVGGLIGEIDVGAHTSISNSFAYGEVTNKTDYSGGLFGSVNQTPTLSEVYWNSSANSTAIGSSSPVITGEASATTADFAQLLDSDLGGNSAWVIHSDYAHPVLGLSALDDRLKVYVGGSINVSITSGSGGTAKVIDGITIFDSDALLGIDTLSSALANGKVIVRSGGMHNLDSEGTIVWEASFNGFSNNLELIANNDIIINNSISWSSNKLLLDAGHDIHINAVITPSGSSQLEMNANTNRSNDTDPFAQTGADNVRASLEGIGRVRVGMKSNDAGFKGKVEFGSRTGTGFLRINSEDYTVINSLSGTAGVVDLDEGPSGDGDLAYDDSSIRYALGTDITNAGSFDNSVVGDGDRNNEFMGVLDGLGHSISGLTLNNSGSGKQHGLFSSLKDATVRNIAITGGYASSGNTGLLAGYSNGNTVLHNILTTGVVSGTLNKTGGLLGSSSTGTLLLDTVSTNVNITSTSSGQLVGVLGGLIGTSGGGSHIVVDSHASGSLTSATGSSTSVASIQGGLYGSMGGTESYYILNSYSTGDINKNGRGGRMIGGMVGRIMTSANVVIDQSFASGDVYGEDQLGGLIGLMDTTGTVKISDTYASGNVLGWPVAGADSAGGLIGEISNGNLLTANNVFSYGKVIHEDDDNVGGLIGKVTSNTPNLTNVFYNSSDNSADIGSGSSTGSMGKTNTEFAAQALATTLGSSKWVYDADYAYPVLNNVSLLPQYIESYSGNIIDVAIGSGSAGSATVIDGVSVFIDDAAIGVDTLNAALASGDVVIKSGGNIFNSEAGKIDINAGFNLSQNQLTLLGSHDINVNAVVSISGDGFIDINTDQYTKDARQFLNTDDNVTDTIASLNTKGRFRTPIASDDSAFTGRIDISGSGYGAISVDGNRLNVIQDLATLEALPHTTHGHYALGSHLGTDGISTDSPMGSYFNGTLDGLGHSLYSLNITQSGAYGGLFSNSSGGLFRNIDLNELTVNANTGAGWAYVGGLVGLATNIVTHNLLLSGSVTNTGLQTGGVIGQLTGDYNLFETISSSMTVNSTLNANNGSALAGGLYGSGGGDTLVHKIHQSGDIRSYGHTVGGLAGQAGSIKVSQSFNTGNINADRNPKSGGTWSTGIGGLIGGANGKTAIENSFSTGDVYGGKVVGGLIGNVSSTSSLPTVLKNVYSSGNVESAITSDSAYAGGLVGAARYSSATSNSGLDVSKSFFYGTVISQHSGVSSGGILGGIRNLGAYPYLPITNGNSINAQVSFENTFWRNQLAPNGTDSLCVVGGGQCGSTNSGTIGSDTSSQDGTTSQVRALTAAQFANPSANLDSGPTSLMDLLGDSFDFESGWSSPGFEEELFSSESQFGPPPIPLYIKTNNGSSVYGSTPSLSYIWVDADGNTFDLSSNSITSSGTISYTNAPDSTSNVGDYSYEYASGLVLSHSTQSYSVLPWNVDGIWSVTPRLLTISGTTVANKVYDRNVNATVTAITGNLSGLLNGDTLGVSASGSFDDKNVGTGKNVTVSYSLADGSGLASNYQLADETLTADITARSVTFSYSASNKSYDGTDNAQVTGSLTGAVNGDDVYLQETARFTDTNAGSGKTIQITDIALNGSDAGNYAIDTQGGSLTSSATAEITKAEPTLIFASQGGLDKQPGDPSFINAVTVNGPAGAVSYNSSDPDIASVDALTGEVTIHKAGIVQIFAEVAETSNSNGASHSFTLNISNQIPDSPGSGNTGSNNSGIDSPTSIKTPQPSHPDGLLPAPKPELPASSVTQPENPGNTLPPVSVNPGKAKPGNSTENNNLSSKEAIPKAGSQPQNKAENNQNNSQPSSSGGKESLGQKDQSQKNFSQKNSARQTDKVNKTDNQPSSASRKLKQEDKNQTRQNTDDNDGLVSDAGLTAEKSNARFSGLKGKADQIVVLSPHGKSSVSYKPQINNIFKEGGFVRVVGFSNPDVAAGNSFQVLVPNSVFIHSDNNQSIEVSAQQEDGSELPLWMEFDAESLSFSGQAPVGADMEVRIQLTARDSSGNTATTGFTLYIK